MAEPNPFMESWYAGNKVRLRKTKEVHTCMECLLYYQNIRENIPDYVYYVVSRSQTLLAHTARKGLLHETT